MQLFFWKKNRQIDAFAHNLANDLYSTVQPDAALAYATQSASKSKKSDAKTARKLDDLIMQVKQFRLDNSVGVYGKARLHLKFMERLKELGYQDKVAEKINEVIMLRTP
jgi:hypothetical protein